MTGSASGQAAPPPPRQVPAAAPAATASAVPAVPRARPVVPVATVPARPVAPPPPAPRPVVAASVAPPPEPQPPAARRPRRGLVPPVVAAEVVLVLVLLVLDRSWPVLVTVACCGVALGAFVTVRVRGQLLCRWVLVALRFLLRARAADLPGEQPGTALLGLVRPGAECAHTMIGDAQAFVVSDATGVGAVLRPESNRRDPVLTPRDLLPGADDALAYAVQVVQHAGVDRSQPARVWLTLRALRTAAVYADEDVLAALANVVRRVRRRLRKAGTPFRPLTEQETLGSYAALAHVNAGRGLVREDWWHWHSGPIRHATFRLDGWAGLSGPAAARLARWLLAAAPDTAVTLSHTAHHDPANPGDPVVGAVLRIATSRPDALAAAVTDVTALAREVGVTLTRWDGRHALGLAATLPLGVTV
ncbi:type VII secretion protein EccE [Actinophytocola sp. KF-1]